MDFYFVYFFTVRGQKMPAITQIAASNLSGSKVFNHYVMPAEPMTITTQQVASISMQGSQMTSQGVPVPTTDIRTALQIFCSWLGQFANPVLVAHNGRRCDFPVLTDAAESVGVLYQMNQCVRGFIDSLKMFSSFKQVGLVIWISSYGAHDALEDVRALCFWCIAVFMMRQYWRSAFYLMLCTTQKWLAERRVNIFHQQCLPNSNFTKHCRVRTEFPTSFANTVFTSVMARMDSSTLSLWKS